MKHVIFKELSEDYDIVKVRSSMLNSFKNPFLWESPNPDSGEECTQLGTIIHEIVQATMLQSVEEGHRIADIYLKELETAKPFYREKEYRWFLSKAHSYVDLASKHKCDRIEVQRKCIVEYSGFYVVFSGTTDCEIGDNTIIDVKSAGSKRKQDKADSERQKYYYSRLKNIKRGTQDDIKFIYHIYTKQFKPQFQTFEYNITFEEAERYVKSDLRSYLTDYKLSSL